MNLPSKTVIPYFFIIVMSGVLFNFSLYISNKNDISNKTITSARIAANEMAKEVAKVYPDGTIQQYRNILTNSIDSPDAAYAVIFSLDRNISFPMFKDEYDSAELRKNIFSVETLKGFIFERMIAYSFSEDIYEISVPVIVSKIYYKELEPKEKILILSERQHKDYDFPEFVDEMAFAVKYAVTLKNIHKAAMYKMRVPVVIFVIAAFFLLAIIFKYEESLFTRLKKLIHVTEKLDKEGRSLFDEIDKNDEIGVLSKNILAMHDRSMNSINNLHLANEYAQSLISSPSISSLFNTIIFEILRLKGIEKGGLLYWNERRNRFVVKETDNFKNIHKEIANDEKFIRWFLANRIVLDSDNFLKNFSSFNKGERQRWGDHGIEVIIPMFQNEKVVGFLNLGKLRNQREYTEEDIKYFKSLVQIAVIAVENLNLRLREAQNIILKKDLDFARDVQSKLLPDSLPMIKGLNFALSMKPARNIGGDYYDFIELDEGNLGICIADVSGKGVAASLVMASTRSYLRLIAKDNYDCRDVLNNLNGLLIKDTNKKMFVTMFYSIFNKNTNELYYSNAGHNYPLIYKAKEKKAKYIKAKGFPLGMIEDFAYDLLKIDVESGDMLIYYTDGIVEAYNDKKELFGFGRLENMLGRLGPLEADEFIEEFLEEFSAYIGEEELSDDYTIIVIKVA